MASWERLPSEEEEDEEAVTGLGTHMGANTEHRKNCSSSEQPTWEGTKQ